jgi:long-chain acyl-CoA synthetase
MDATNGADIIHAAKARTLTGLLLERVRRSAERVAYVRYEPGTDRWRGLRWRSVSEAAGRWQAALRREDLNSGDRVALQLSNRPEWVYFDMAALGLGLVNVPLYTNDRPENIRHILEDAGVRLLLLESGERLADLAPIAESLKPMVRILVLEPGDAERAGTVEFTPVEQWLGDATAALEDRVEDPDDLATIVYTSGTTGAPKGVMLSHHNILWDTEASLSSIAAFPQDRFLSFLPLSHALERTGGYYLPMMAGSSVAYARSIPLLGEDLQIIRPTVLIAVPRIFERVHAKIQAKLESEPKAARKLFEMAVDVGWHGFEHAQGRRAWSPDLLLAPLLDRLVGRKIRERLGGRLRIAMSGGAPIPPDIARVFVGLGIPLAQGYGLTEASPVVTVSPMEDNIPASVGLPLPGLQTRIGPRNELLVKSPGVMSGYWNQPQATSAAIDSEGWLHTGDQVRLDGEHVFITGRLKEVLVLSNGEKVAPAELEMAIMLDGLFSQILVIGEGRPYLTALTVLDPDVYPPLAQAQGLSADDPIEERLNPRLEEILIERVNERLQSFPGYAKILRIAVVKGPWTIDSGLLTPTLKLKRANILKQFNEDIERLYEGHA